MKLLTKTILMSAMLLAACNKKSDSTPAQNNEATNAQPTVSSAKAPVDEFENASAASMYNPHTFLMNEDGLVAKGGIYYTLKFRPVYNVYGKNENGDLGLYIHYSYESYDLLNLKKNRRIKTDSKIRFFTDRDPSTIRSTHKTLIQPLFF